MPRQPGKPRERLVPPASQSYASVTTRRMWMTADWRARRVIRLRRLGEWVAAARARLGMSLLDVEHQARRDGEDISETLIRRLEGMRLTGANLDDVRRVSLPAVDYLAALAGMTLGDVDAYLRTGEAAAMEPSLDSRAETVRAAFLSLSPARQQALEDFAQHLYQLDLAETGAASVASAISASAASDEALTATTTATQRARDELRAVSDGAMRALGDGAADHTGERPGEKRRKPGDRQAR